MKRLVSMVHRHQHAAEDTSQRHSAERTENHFLFSLTSPATQINTSDSPFSPSFLGCRAEGADAEPTTPSTTSLPLSSYRQGLPAPVATIALLRAAQGDHHASKSGVLSTGQLPSLLAATPDTFPALFATPGRGDSLVKVLTSLGAAFCPASTSLCRAGHLTSPTSQTCSALASPTSVCQSQDLRSCLYRNPAPTLWQSDCLQKGPDWLRWCDKHYRKLHCGAELAPFFPFTTSHFPFLLGD